MNLFLSIPYDEGETDRSYGQATRCHDKCSREHIYVEKGVGISLDLSPTAKICHWTSCQLLKPDDIGLRNLALEIALIFLPEAAIQKITPPEIDNQMILFRFLLCGLANYICLDCL